MMDDEKNGKDEEILSIEFVEPEPAERPTPPSGTAPPPADETLKAELEQTRDKYLRALAEMENLKKRIQKEREDFVLYGLQSFLKDLLPILDNLRRALAEAPAEDKMAEGVALILRQAEGLLERAGVTPIPAAEGDPFDPFIHEALSTEPSPDVERPVIKRVLRTGHYLNQRLLRPVLVHALIPAPKDDHEPNPGN